MVSQPDGKLARDREGRRVHLGCEGEQRGRREPHEEANDCEDPHAGGLPPHRFFPLLTFFGSSGFRVGLGSCRTRSGPGKGIALPRLSERPFRALPGGSLPEFLRPRLRATAVPQSVPAFHPGKASVGTPLLRRSQRSPLAPARNYPHHFLESPFSFCPAAPAARPLTTPNKRSLQVPTAPFTISALTKKGQRSGIIKEKKGKGLGVRG